VRPARTARVGDVADFGRLDAATSARRIDAAIAVFD